MSLTYQYYYNAGREGFHKGRPRWEGNSWQRKAAQAGYDYEAAKIDRQKPSRLIRDAVADPRYFPAENHQQFGAGFADWSTDFLCDALKFKHDDSGPNVVRTIGFIEQAICSQFFAVMGFHYTSPSSLTLGRMLRVTGEVATYRAERRAVHVAWFEALADRLEKQGE